ncbi:hypothetical protein DENSPDRAFT_854367 [Dentipellis sp. KUC8613]|nr:hypothetical protein DENSPDRAFT_854367 [Dentipellis sp. KUC8613]
MLRTNSRLLKLANARIEFGRRGMLKGDVTSHALKQVDPGGTNSDSGEDDDGNNGIGGEGRHGCGGGSGEDNGDDGDGNDGSGDDEGDNGGGRDAGDGFDVAGVDGEPVQSITELPKRQVSTRSIDALATELHQPNLLELIRRFLWDQCYDGDDISGEHALIGDCPVFVGSVRTYRTATSTFYAPSELAGSGGMHRELLRSVASWYNGYGRYDTVLIQAGDSTDRMGGMLVGRVRAFLAFTHDKML